FFCSSCCDLLEVKPALFPRHSLPQAHVLVPAGCSDCPPSCYFRVLPFNATSVGFLARWTNAVPIEAIRHTEGTLYLAMCPIWACANKQTRHPVASCVRKRMAGRFVSLWLSHTNSSVTYL